jgi:DNA-directed RNA polymerase specialized sigma24 family protein
MAESVSGSVTQWIGELRSGDADAAGKLWERYFGELVRVASGQLRGAPCAVADEEDVALSVFDTLCRRMSSGKLQKLNDRHELWRLLVVIVRQKSIDHRRLQGRKKRGGDKHFDHSLAEAGLDELLGEGPGPGDIATMREELSVLLGCLPDAALRQVAVAKLQGHSNQEMADLFNVTERTVERKIKLIRTLWLHRLAP